MTTGEDDRIEVWKDGHALAARLRARDPNDAHWLPELQRVDPRVLIAAIGELGMKQDLSWQESARDAARAMVELKLTERMIVQMESLERQTRRVERVGIFIGVAGLVLAGVQLCVSG